MAEAQRTDFTTESQRAATDFGEESQRVDLRTVTKPPVHYRLLTIRDAEREFGLNGKRIYAAVLAGLVHPVKPNGRTLYPEWELAAIAKCSYHLVAA